MSSLWGRQCAFAICFTYKERTPSKPHKYNQRKARSVKDCCYEWYAGLQKWDEGSPGFAATWLWELWLGGGPQTPSASSCLTEQLGEPTGKKTRAVALNPVQEEDKALLCFLLPKGQFCGHRICYRKPARRKAYLRPGSEESEWSFCDDTPDSIGKYRLSLNCAVISSFREDTEAGFVAENYSRVTLVQLIFMNCRREQDKDTHKDRTSMDIENRWSSRSL